MSKRSHCLIPQNRPAASSSTSEPSAAIARLTDRLCRPFTVAFWQTSHHQWYGALVASTILHLALIALLGAWWINHVRGAPSAIDTRWAPPVEKVDLTQIETVQNTGPEAEDNPGGVLSGDWTFEPQASSSVDVSLPALNAPNAPLADAEPFPAEDLAVESGAPAIAESNDADASGTGQGDGQGDGTGSGSGFFGIRAPGTRFVYVVDGSGSMNHPHPSEAKTRFRRLKLELVKSVLSMDSRQSFFIIFFNDQAIPMPARQLQPATRRSKNDYLRWAAQIDAGGETEPRDALAIALRLQPDVIYFLTDGSFKYKVNQELLKLRQDRTAIHTFAFGNRDAEELLKEIAANNGGDYHFVP